MYDLTEFTGQHSDSRSPNESSDIIDLNWMQSQLHVVFENNNETVYRYFVNVNNCHFTGISSSTRLPDVDDLK